MRWEKLVVFRMVFWSVRMGTRDTILVFVTLASVTKSVAGDFKLRILHTNDMHSRYDEVASDLTRCQSESDKCYGGFARVRGKVDELIEDGKKKQISTLYLDAGDVFQETIYYTQYKWDLAQKMMNLLKPDATTLGNHEFDDGVEGLIPYLDKLNVPVICSNVNVDDEPGLKANAKILSSKEFQFGNVKVGVIGYTSPQITSKHLGKVKIADEIDTVSSVSAKLKKDGGVKIVIALGHSGYSKDKEIAEKVENIDVIVGAHSHTFLYSGSGPSEHEVSGPYPTMITNSKSKKQVPVVQAYFGTKYLGQLDLTFDDAGNILKEHSGKLILLDGSVKKDAVIANEIKPYTEEINRNFGKKLGHTEVLYTGGRKKCRIEECNIGNLVADAFLHHASKVLDIPIHAALVDSKSIKESLYPKGEEKSGDILYQDVMVVLPYGFPLKVLKLTGAILRQALESGFKDYNPDKEGLLHAHLLQVSGLRVRVDLTKPYGKRVVSVKVAPDYKRIRDDSNYNVVMSNYLASNKDKFPSLVGQPVAKELPEIKDYDVLANYIESIKLLTEQTSKIEGRIITKKPTIFSYFRHLIHCFVNLFKKAFKLFRR